MTFAVDGSGFVLARDLGESFGDSFFPSCALIFFFFFFSGDQLAHINPPPFFFGGGGCRVSPQWLSELRRMWPRAPWLVACELVSLIGSHTMPGQHSQQTPTSLGQGCMRV